MATTQKITVRLSLPVNSLAPVLKGLQHYKDTSILSVEDSLAISQAMLSIRKQQLNISAGVTASVYVGVPLEKQQRTSRDSLIVSLGGTEELISSIDAAVASSSKELTDSEKLALMSPEEQEEFWNAQFSSVVPEEVVPPK